ncbi:RdgB/HAM1 family non-canonical purine NTP pyrophosphatase [Thiomicrorhabdus sp. ZW0627]|uniref:RdgB/HAM1 family non-canonical purine NTP pyrophosphatase n=1 Tax=Thiomicrorhabdus sp. ZW0627 TaxID=3039774 RepID=UPI0024362C84|nr:RdgB/HAM1 family non-canonical purine NTP pyrophosphatase [Thiomicrorhabdus sp. ZW0627]MDG6773478.1 RdgB/HAM1 family non-canonical purine NTP pyrophosphatase [Thiomicrorhabdus sp. ZW0627]
MTSPIILATANPNKVEELEPMLSRAGIVTKPQTEFFREEAIEDGLSFVENAIIKARFASEKTGLPALADDSGLEVEALNGQPGIYSARYAGTENGSEEQNLKKLLSDMAMLPYPQRQARYSCAVVYVKHSRDPMPLIGIGHWYGEILMKPRTGFGIGYDDVMWIPELVKAVSEIPFEVKNQISHRARAVQSVINQLNQSTGVSGR